MNNSQIAGRINQIAVDARQRMNGSDRNSRQVILEDVLQALDGLVGDVAGAPSRATATTGSRASRADAQAAAQVQRRGWQRTPAGQGHAVRPVRP